MHVLLNRNVKLNKNLSLCYVWWLW